MRDREPSPLLNERQVAQALGLTPRTIQVWRTRGPADEGPPLPFVKISSRCIRYRLEDVERFAAQRLRLNTSDDGNAAEACPRLTGEGQ